MHWRRCDGDVAVMRMLHVLEELCLLQIGVVQQVGQLAGRPAGNIEFAQDRKPFGGGALLMPSVSTAYSASTLSERAAIVAKRGSWISARAAHRLEQPAPLCIAVGDHARCSRPWSRKAGDAASACADSPGPVPARPSTAPHRCSTSRKDSIVSSIGTCTSCPCPVRSRWNSAMPIIEASICAGQLVHHHAGQVARRAIRPGVQRGDARSSPGSGRRRPETPASALPLRKPAAQA